jgi:hypothetical protein
MATQTLEAIFLHSSAVARQKRSIGNQDVDRTPVVKRATAIPLERRCETRMEYRCRCSYEVAEAIDKELAFFERGEAFALNRSLEGMLLVMGHDRQVTQLIEVHAFHSRWGQTANVYEVRWTRPLPVESFGNLYLVGCRRIFGPSYFRSF